MTRPTPPDLPAEPQPDPVEPDNVLWRRAPLIAGALGTAAAIALLVFAPGGPWWMPLLAFCVVGVVAFRLLRPRPRQPGWEDEL